MNLNTMSILEVSKEIQKPVESFDIREMVMNLAIPFEWCKADYSHPIQSLGYFYFGIGDGFRFDQEKVDGADDLLLWKLYALATTYWLIHYQNWNNSK